MNQQCPFTDRGVRHMIYSFFRDGKENLIPDNVRERFEKRNSRIQLNWICWIALAVILVLVSRHDSQFLKTLIIEIFVFLNILLYFVVYPPQLTPDEKDIIVKRYFNLKKSVEEPPRDSFSGFS